MPSHLLVLETIVEVVQLALYRQVYLGANLPPSSSQNFAPVSPFEWLSHCAIKLVDELQKMSFKVLVACEARIECYQIALKFTPTYTGHGTSIEVCPASLISIVPPHIHINVELSLRAGWPATSTVEAPGDQGAVVSGMQGMGVNTPSAAAVAATTVGFDSEVHITKGMMFIIGI